MNRASPTTIASITICVCFQGFVWVLYCVWYSGPSQKKTVVGVIALSLSLSQESNCLRKVWDVGLRERRGGDGGSNEGRRQTVVVGNEDATMVGFNPLDSLLILLRLYHQRLFSLPFVYMFLWPRVSHLLPLCPYITFLLLFSLQF